MAILAIGLNAMKGTLGGSAALMVAALALAVFAPIFALLGAMSWKSIAKGLISIAGAIVILGVAGAVLCSDNPCDFRFSGGYGSYRRRYSWRRSRDGCRWARFNCFGCGHDSYCG